MREWINKFLGRSDIEIDGDVYMRRWRFLHLDRFGIRVHHILRSDSDRELHDHPFDFISVILWGGYYENRNDGSKTWYGPGSIVFRKAETLHRLDLKPDELSHWLGEPTEKPAWTLVFRGPLRRQWGFQTDQGWVPWQDFVSAKVRHLGGDGKENPRNPYRSEGSY